MRIEKLLNDANIALLTKERDEARAYRDAAVKEMADHNTASANALEMLWKDIVLKRKPDYGPWEYPAQAYRHIMDEVEEMVEEAK